MLPDTQTAPFAVVFATFYAIAFIRTLVTYGLGRYATVAARRHASSRDETTSTSRTARLARRVARLGDGAGTQALRTWGLVAIPLSFLATGTKTVVNAAAGLLEVPFWRYLPLMAVGVAAHATIYSVVGWAAWQAVVMAAARSPWAAAALAAGLVALVATVLVRRRRRGPTAASGREPATDRIEFTD